MKLVRTGFMVTWALELSTEVRENITVPREGPLLRLYAKQAFYHWDTCLVSSVNIFADRLYWGLLWAVQNFAKVR